MGPRAVMLAALLAAIVVVGLVPSAPPDDIPLERAEVHRDGDFIVYEAKAAGTSAPSVRNNGYATYADTTLREAYTIRLVDTTGVEHLRPDLEAIAVTMRDVIGQYVVVADGTVPYDARTRAGQIDVRVSSNAPCAGLWLGCAAPTVVDGEVQSAQVWIHPRLLQRSSASISNGIRHEIGHAFGLAHYDAAWEGQVQTMHSTSFDATEYRSGDLNGLRAIAVHATRRTPTTAPPEPAPRPAPAVVPRVVDPSGSVSDVVATGFGIVVRGHAHDPDSTEPIGVLITMDDEPFELLASRQDPDTGDAHGFEVVWSVEPGTHHVCVIARNVGEGVDTPLGCHDVVVTPTSVGQLGLQTL
ncbi:hypothetical protein [Actinospongicola halichondriae]|uniref:hypothetical protein n=1 Tax=Actinospongicola halichondriae TaxID=3236844 RepID=UPI003D4935FF